MQTTLTMHVRQSVRLAANALGLARKIEQQLDELRARRLLWRC